MLAGHWVIACLVCVQTSVETKVVKPKCKERSTTNESRGNRMRIKDRAADAIRILELTCNFEFRAVSGDASGAAQTSKHVMGVPTPVSTEREERTWYRSDSQG